MAVGDLGLTGCNDIEFDVSAFTARLVNAEGATEESLPSPLVMVARCETFWDHKIEGGVGWAAFPTAAQGRLNDWLYRLRTSVLTWCAKLARLDDHDALHALQTTLREHTGDGSLRVELHLGESTEHLRGSSHVVDLTDWTVTSWQVAQHHVTAVRCRSLELSPDSPNVMVASDPPWLAPLMAIARSVAGPATAVRQQAQSFVASVQTVQPGIASRATPSTQHNMPCRFVGLAEAGTPAGDLLARSVTVKSQSSLPRWRGLPEAKERCHVIPDARPSLAVRNLISRGGMELVDAATKVQRPSDNSSFSERNVPFSRSPTAALGIRRAFGGGMRAVAIARTATPDNVGGAHRDWMSAVTLPNTPPRRLPIARSTAPRGSNRRVTNTPPLESSIALPDFSKATLDRVVGASKATLMTTGKPNAQISTLRGKLEKDSAVVVANLRSMSRNVQ